MKLKHTLIALASSTLLFTGAAQAADATATTAAHPAKMTDRMMAKSGNMKADREQLQQKLRAGKTREDYQKILKDNGYRISAINEDKKDYLEYEVVKAGFSYEVQIDFKDNATQASKVEVENNMWRADATKRMMKDEKYQHAGPLVADTKGTVSAPQTPVSQAVLSPDKSGMRRFQGSSASTSSTVLAAGKSRITRRSQAYGSNPLALAVCTKE